MTPHPLSRRAVCAAPLLAVGLAATRWAQANAPAFETTFHFRAGDAPSSQPAPMPDPLGRGRRLGLITTKRGWRLTLNGRATRHGTKEVATATCSHLTLASDGRAYGTEELGGPHGCGTVFWWPEGQDARLHRLFSFDPDGHQGLRPRGGVIQGFDGALYGTTFQGGESNRGAIYRLTLDGQFSLLDSFGGTGEGWLPIQGLTAASNGHYYGATANGGSQNLGTLYRLTSKGKMEVLFTFFGGEGDDRMGIGPRAALLQSPDGLLYGMGSSGGKFQQGALFSLSHHGKTQPLHQFNGAEGGHPLGSLTAAADGALYGTCSQGGAFGHGTVFKFIPAQRQLTVLHHFENNLAEGGRPLAALTWAGDGMLYGTTQEGGEFGGGTMFRISP